jgi:transposase
MTPPVDPTSLSGAEKDALIATLLARLEELSARIAALEAENAALRSKLGQPPKTPDNSSTPPSRGHKPNAEPASKEKGKRKAHPGAHRALHPSPTRRRDVVASHCPHCHADVSGAVQIAMHAYDRIEITKIEPDVTRVTLHGGTCPCCAKTFKAEPPPSLEPGSPFGPNLRAFALYLRFSHAISFERLARLMSDLLGLAISEGALVNMLEDARSAFAAQAEAIRQRLLAGTALQSDETGMRVGKRNWWAWVFHHDDSAYFMIEPSRGKKVVHAFLGEHRPEFWVSDRLAAQMGWATKEHQVCLAHLLRDAQYAIDCGDDAFAPGVKKLLADACAIARRRPRLADTTLRAYAAKIEGRIDALLRIAPPSDQGKKLQAVIKKYRQNLFVFLVRLPRQPRHSANQQRLRAGAPPCAIYRKVTNGFRSEWGARFYANIRSVIETARRRDIPILNAIRLTLCALPLTAGP